MLSNRLKALYAVVLLFGSISIASACHYNYDTACGGQDPYSKFSSTCCSKACPEYPQQRFLNPSA